MSFPDVSLEVSHQNLTPVQPSPDHVSLDGKLSGRNVKNNTHSGCPFSGKLGVINNEQDNQAEETPLSKHARFFANEKGQLTPLSMYHALRRMKISYFKSVSIAFSVTIGNIFKNGFKSLNVSEAHKLIHPCDSKIFLPDGTIDEATLNALLDRFPNQDFISQNDINNLRAEFSERDKEKDTMGIYSSASAGEFDLLLECCTDHLDGDIPCLKKESIRQFYKDSSVLFEKSASGELPIKKPAS